MLYKYGKHTREYLGHFYFYFSFINFDGVFITTIIPLAPFGYEMITDNFNPTCLAGYLPSHIQRALVE